MTDTDEALVARVTAGGDRRAFAMLVSRHQGVVRGLLARLTGGAPEADDLAQETFVQAWRRIETYRGQGSFRPWLCQIAYSRFLMGLRREKSRQRLLDAAAREPAELASSPGQPGSRVDLDRALAMLGDDERHCVVLCYAAGLSHSDAASITGLPLGTVKSHVTRGRARLKDWFDRQESAA